MQYIRGLEHYDNARKTAVTFGKFFKERQEVGIHADDLGLGIDKVFYLISEEAKTLEEVQNIQASDWTVYEQRFAIDPDKKCIVYVKITDKGGNTAYLSTDGLVFDGSSPVISGVKHNETYGGSVQFTVNDDNLDYVEIDGVLAGRENGGYTVTDVEGAHTITAVDKAGNRTQVSVTIVHATQPTTEAPKPTQKPTEAPTEKPTQKPTQATTESTTEGTTEAPKPTQKPTEAPTEVTKPTEAPTQKPETDEKVIYEMRQDGLRQVNNPSELLLSQDHEGMSGVAIASAIEGIRPFLIETQALVSSAVYGNPQRSATGFDLRRMNMLLAVLEKRVGFKLAQKDVFLNIAGGLKVNDPAIDLAVISAILSSNMDAEIDAGVCMAGEVGLSGEIRPVNRIEQRIGEAEKLGFKRMIIPKHNLQGLDKRKIKIELVPVRKVEEAFRELFG